MCIDIFRKRDTVPILLSHVWLWCSTSEIELILALWISWNYDQVTTVRSLPVGMLNQKSSYSTLVVSSICYFAPNCTIRSPFLTKIILNMLQVGGFNHLPSILVPREGSICAQVVPAVTHRRLGSLRPTQRALCGHVGSQRGAPWDWKIFATLNLVGLFEMGVSKNSGTPKSSNLIGFSIIHHPFWGTPIFGNTQMKIMKLNLTPKS